jgi:hypothetical protein
VRWFSGSESGDERGGGFVVVNLVCMFLVGG